MGSGTLPLRDLTALVRGELERINRELEDDLRPQERDLLPLVDLVTGYRGKQIRPALVCLAGKAIGRLTDDHIAVAKVVELLHTATLIHDDVLDGARLRRRMPTANALYGSEAPILLGDYIYALAFHLSVKLEDPTCSRVLSEVVRRMCQGEITQILHRFDFDWSESRYTDVITEKTALLYGSACRLGGYYAGGRGAALSSLERFGTELGIAFQIVDDCLDLDGDEDVVGKSLGTDLGMGKLTLPLLFLLEDGRDGPRLRALIESDAPDGEKLRRLRSGFDLELAIRRSIKAAELRIDCALAALRELPESAARDNLEAMAVFVLERRQ